MESEVTLKKLVAEVIDEMDGTVLSIEDIRIAMNKIEEYVAGHNAACYRAAERLINTAAAAIEEAQTWLKDVE